MSCKKLPAIRIVALVVLIVAIAASNLAGAASADSRELTAAAAGHQALGFGVSPVAGASPLQQALQSMLDERGRAGLPVPHTVSYDSHLGDPEVIQNRDGSRTRVETLTATTVVQFDHPRQAGLERWPDVDIGATLPAGATGSVLPGDYSLAVGDRLAKAIPGVWDRYVFGYEPRTYTFAETITFSYPEEGPLVALTPGSLPEVGTARDLVVGVSTAGPRLDYVLQDSVCPLGICLWEAKVGFQLDWDIGFRLPITVDLSGPRPLLPGSRPFSIAITGRDWSAQQFQQVGLAPVDGNEFVLQYVFFMGAKASILGVNVVDAAWEGSFNGSKSFTTPVGLGASFPLSALDLSPEITGLRWSFYDALAVGIGLSITPNLKAGGITANWQATGDAAGSGQLTYNASGAPVRFANINIGDFNATTRYASIRTNSIRYRFSEFKLGLGGYLQFELFGYAARSGTFKISDFDLTPLTGGLWLPPHQGTTSDFSTDFLVYKGSFLPSVRR